MNHKKHVQEKMNHKKHVQEKKKVTSTSTPFDFDPVQSEDVRKHSTA